MNLEQKIFRALRWIVFVILLVAGIYYFPQIKSAFAGTYHTPTAKHLVEHEEPSVFTPDMHEFTLQPGGPTVTIQTNGRPFKWDGSGGKWLVQIQNRKGVWMSPSGLIGGWDIDQPGNNITIPNDVRAIKFFLPKRDGLMLTLPVKIAVWYTD